MEDLRVVYESTNRQSCSDRALVLASVQIPHQLVDDGMSCVLVVPAEYSPRAVEELRLYDDENPPTRPKPRKHIVYQDALPGVIGYVFVVCAVAWLAGYSFFGINWFVAGRVDGTLIRDGEWLRTSSLGMSGIVKLLSSSKVSPAIIGIITFFIFVTFGLLQI